MAKRVVKQRKRKVRWTGMMSFIFLLTGTTYLFSQVFVQTENTKLMKSIQDVEVQIAGVKSENEVLTANIQDLRNYNRVVSIATEAGLTVQNNAVTIKLGD